MNTLKKFSVETHKGWASFQLWIKKWNKIMAVIFSALGITLLLSTVIVNALEVHEENQELLKLGNENPRLNLFEVCHCVHRNKCVIYCSAGTSTDISNELNFHWEKNPHCQSIGMSVEILSTVQFAKFTLPADWLNGNFKLKYLRIDLENIFVICENAFAGEVFKLMQKLIFNNLHLHTMDTMILQKLVAEQHFKHLTITKSSFTEQLATAIVEFHADSMSYSETDAEYQIHNPNNLDETISSGNMSQSFIICLTIVCCVLSFSLGLLIRYNLFKQKMFFNKIDKANHMIFVVENNVTRLRGSVVMQNEK